MRTRWRTRLANEQRNKEVGETIRFTNTCGELSKQLQHMTSQHRESKNRWSDLRADRMYIHHCISTRRWWRECPVLNSWAHTSQRNSWTINITALVKKAQKRLYFLRMLRKVNLSQQLLLSFYRCSIESVLTHGMLVWYGSSSAADKNALQRVIKTSQNITQQQLPALDKMFASHCLQKIHNILKDSYHPAHNLFELLPSGKRYRSIKTRTTRFMNSFYPKAITITILNTELKIHSWHVRRTIYVQIYWALSTLFHSARFNIIMITLTLSCHSGETPRSSQPRLKF